MKFTLKDYQDEAVRDVLTNLRKARKRWQEDGDKHAFSLTAATYTTEPPAIDSYVRFSKEFYVGGVCINMPPFTTEQPTGCPVRPTDPDGTSDDSDEINF